MDVIQRLSLLEVCKSFYKNATCFMGLYAVTKFVFCVKFPEINKLKIGCLTI